jgi:hypothetical protein
MAWGYGTLLDMFGSEPKLPEGQPTKLPDYFPVEPKGCLKHSERLFACLSNEATVKARDMEKLGYHKSFYGLPVRVPDNIQEMLAEGTDLPKPTDNPLDPCRTAIAYYKRCCDRELKKKENWILTEPYRVQEEYRYSSSGAK